MLGEPQTPDKSGFANINPENLLKAPIVCCSGCLTLLVINGLILWLFVLPAFRHRDLVRICFNHRQLVARGMQAKMASVKNLPVNELPKLETPSDLRCTEGGTYHLSRQGTICIVRCSIANHDQSGNASFAIPTIRDGY